MQHRKYRLARVRLAIAEDRRGQFVEHGYVHVRMVMRHIAHEIGSDKPTSASHDNVARLENLTTHYFRVPAGLHS